MDENCCECRHKDVPRDENEIKLLRNRLNRIIGQLNGIMKMLDDNRYCGDILMQVAAAESALQNVGYVILQDHMKSCMVDKIQNGDKEVIDEVLDLMKKLK